MGICGEGFLLKRRASSIQRPYQVLVAPISPRSSARHFAFAPRRAAALVIVGDPNSTPQPAAEVLRRLFGLTPTLARLAEALASGKTLIEYASEHEVTLGTARQQLKELFARTGTHRQSELIRLVLTSGAVLRTREVAG